MGTPARQSKATAAETEPRVSDTFVAYLAQRAEEEGVNLNYEVSARQLDKLLIAESEEALWEIVQRDSIGARDLEDVELQVHDFSVHKGGDQFEAPLGVFIVVNSTRLANGEDEMFNTGSPLIIGILRWYEAKGLLPYNFVVRGAPTPRGRRLWLEKIPQRMMQAKAEPTAAEPAPAEEPAES